MTPRWWVTVWPQVWIFETAPVPVTLVTIIPWSDLHLCHSLETLHLSLTSLAKMESWPHRKDNTTSITTCACSVVAPATLQKIVQNHCHLPLKPKPEPSRPKVKKHKNPCIWKKTEQSPALCTAWGLCWPFLCLFWGCPTQHVCSFWSQLSQCFPDLSAYFQLFSPHFHAHWLWFYSLLCGYQLCSIL